MDASEDEDQDDPQNRNKPCPNPNSEMLASISPPLLPHNPTASASSYTSPGVSSSTSPTSWSSTSPGASSTPLHPTLPASSPPTPRASTSPPNPELIGLAGPSHLQFSSTRSPSILRDVMSRMQDLSPPTPFQSRNLCQKMRQRYPSLPTLQSDLSLLDEADDSDISYPISHLSSFLAATDNDDIDDVDDCSLPSNISTMFAEDTTPSLATPILPPLPSPARSPAPLSLQTSTSPADHSLGQSELPSLRSPELILDDEGMLTMDVDTNSRGTVEEIDDSWNLPLRLRLAQQHVPRWEQLRNSSSVLNTVPVESPLHSSDSDEIDFPALIARKKLVAKQQASETYSSSESERDQLHVSRVEQLQNSSSVPNTGTVPVESPLLSSDSDEIDFPVLIARKKLVAKQQASDTSSSSESDSDQQPVPRLERLGNSSVLNTVPDESRFFSSDSDDIDFPALIARKKLVAKQQVSETSSSDEDEIPIVPIQASVASNLPNSTISASSSSTQRRASCAFLPPSNSAYPTLGRITTQSASVEDEEIAGFIDRMKVRRERLHEIEMELRDNVNSSENVSRHLDNHNDVNIEEQRRITKRTARFYKKQTENAEQQVVIARPTANTPTQRSRTADDINEDLTEQRRMKQRRRCISPTYPRLTVRPNIAISVSNDSQTTGNHELSLISHDPQQDHRNRFSAESNVNQEINGQSNIRSVDEIEHQMIPRSRCHNQELISSMHHSTVSLDQGLIPMPTLQFRPQSLSGNNADGNITEVVRNTDESSINNPSIGIDTDSSINRRSRLVHSGMSTTGSHCSLSPRRESLTAVSLLMSNVQALQRTLEALEPSSYTSQNTSMRPRILGEDVAIDDVLTTIEQYVQNSQEEADRLRTNNSTGPLEIRPRPISLGASNIPRIISSTSPLDIHPISLEASNRPRTNRSSSPMAIPLPPLTESDRSSSSVDIHHPSLTISSATSSSSESGTSGLPGASLDEHTTHLPIEDSFFYPRLIISRRYSNVEDTISEEVVLPGEQGITPTTSATSRIRLRRDPALLNVVGGARSTDEVLEGSSRSYEADMAEAIKRSLEGVEEIYQSSNEGLDKASPEIGIGMEQDSGELSSSHPGSSHWSGRGGASSLPMVPSASNLSGPNWQLKYKEILGKYLKLISNLQSTVECPVCMEIPRSAPIPCCRSGHVMCATCWSRSRQCPTCRRDLRPSERCVSHVANQLVDLLPHPCTNRDDGCPYEAQASEVEVHERDCEFRLIRCPSYQCKKQACMKKLDQHIHRAKVPPHTTWCHVENYPLLVTRRLAPSSLQSFEPVRFIFEGRQCFLQTVASENKKLLMFYFVQMCGTRQDCEGYSARIEVSGKGGFTASQVCQVTSLDLHCLEDQHMIWNKFVMQDRVFLNMLHPNKSFSVSIKMWKN